VTDDRSLRILVIDRMPPISLQQGNSLIGRHVFSRLGKHELTLVAPVTADERTSAAAELRSVFDAVHLVDVPRIPTAHGGWLHASLPGARAIGWPRAFRTAVDRAAGTAGFDIVHVRQLPMAPFGRDVSARGRLLELVDSETLATSRDRRTGLRIAARRRLAPTIERRAMAGYDVVTTVAEADASLLRTLVGGTTRVDVMPNGVDAATFAPIPVETAPTGLVFVGAMSFPPNVAAVTWFAEQVFPRVRALRPTTSFAIVGRDPAPAVSHLASLPGVVVTGAVADVRPWLAQAAVVVCPMVSGSGIKNKVLEAMAMARPVVATSLAVDGLGVSPGIHVELADDSQAMTTTIVRLLDDAEGRASIGSAARAFVRGSYSWEACAERYEALYEKLAGPRSPDAVVTPGTARGEAHLTR
jgi:glycosyltransferase involved in cell wall biosynthesis